MNCGLLRRHVDAYVDGEVDPTTQIEFERHLAVCASCQEVVAFMECLKREVRQSACDVKVPTGLRTRICTALDQAERRQERPPLVRFVPMRTKIAVPVALAAAAALALGLPMDGAVVGSTSNASAASAPIFEDVVRLHSSGLPADVPGEQPQQVSRYFRNKVTFPVRPAVFQRRDARLVGARLSNVRDRRAAALFYEVAGRRLTVVVFDPPAPLEQGAIHTRLLGRQLYYRHVSGYTVPVRRERGLTYAFTGDLDSHQLLRLAASARVQN